MKPLWFIVFLLAAIAVLYLPFLGNSFLSDDLSAIVDVAPSWTWVSAIGWPKIIHLGVLLQFWAYKLFGLVAWPFRLTNILFHAGNAILVFLVVKRLTKPFVGVLTSLLFAVHPLAVESVTWISGGVYSQYAFFFLLSFWFYLNASSFIFYLLSCILYILSLLISEKAVSLIFLYIFYELVFRNIGKNWKKLIPFVLVCIVFTGFYVSRISMRMTDVSNAVYQPVTGILNPFIQIPVATSSYLKLFLFPIHLTLYHSELSMTWWEFGVRLVVTMGYVGVLVWLLLKKKAVGFWFVWPIIALGVTLLPLRLSWIVAERYLYLGMVGWCVVMALLVDWVMTKKKHTVGAIGIGIVLLLALFTRTILRNSDWRSAETLWPATLRESPSDPHSWNNMGDVLSRRGEYEKSIEAFTVATKINPNYADAYHNIGNTYLLMQRYDTAIPFYEKALSINPNLWQSYQDLGFIAAAQKKYGEAVRYYEKALSINPNEKVLLQNFRVVKEELRRQQQGVHDQ